MNSTNLEVRIEELVLYGFAPGDRYRIGDAMEHELARVFTGQDMSPSLGPESKFERLNSGAFEVKPGSKAEAIGVEVAQAVYRGLSA